MKTKGLVEFRNELRDGMTIAISGIDSSYYPKQLIREVKNSGVKDLTLIYIEDNTDLDDGDPMELIYNGQVRKLITSHLGQLQKKFHEYMEEVELLPMDILAFKMKAGADRLSGITMPYDYVSLYRDEKVMEEHGFEVNGEKFAFEPALNCDMGIIVVDQLDPTTRNSSFDGTAFTSIEVSRMGDICYAETLRTGEVSFDDTDIPGAYITGYIKHEEDEYKKTNWV